jgi:hypothetical protein
VATIGELVEESLAELVAAAETDAVTAAGDQTRAVGKSSRSGRPGRTIPPRGPSGRPPTRRTDNR